MDSKTISVTTNINSSNISAKARDLWNAWDIRVLILSSLLIQVILTFLAPLRKRSANGALNLILWVLYLSTTTVALYIISHISSSPNNESEMVHLLAFWAPFLLLHLGGPDTITALALEDNELWHRHVLELIAQSGVTLYVFAYSVMQHKSELLLPTVLMFVNGGIKYLERVQALYYASIDSVRDSLETDPEPGPNYARLMDVYSSSTTAYIPSEIQRRDDSSSIGSGHGQRNTTTSEGGPNSQEVHVRASVNSTTSDGNKKPSKGNNEDKLIIKAYDFYNKFKGLLADNFLSLKDLKKCRDYFVKKEATKLVKIIEIELNLMYDVFYTKAFLLDTKQAFLRVITFISVIVSLVWFCFLDKSMFHMTDIVVSYTLLGGAIALDISTGIMFIFSDWYAIVLSRDKKLKNWKSFIFKKILKLSKSWRRPKNKRWSRSISDYNLLRCCFKDPPFIIKYLVLRRIKDALTSWIYARGYKFHDDSIVMFIAEELKKKAILVKEDHTSDLKVIKEVCSARGNLFLEDDYFLISEYLQPWTTDVDYDESLLTWHLATDICYYTLGSSSEQKVNEKVEISKKLSDYMTYLILKRQTLVSTMVGMSDTRFTDTHAEVKKFVRTTCQKLKFRTENEFMVEICTKLLNVHVDVKAVVAKGDKSKSVLFEACRLAKQLKMLGEEKQWEITSKVWLEMMCYAAVRCSPRSHVAQLNKGGQLITVVWLLMAHLGFGERFLQNQGFGWTKLVIQK